ncbi:LacI family DNA-binding transcriptional regulator [Deinococcus rubellus]|uniref:LacI family transcriptional regulator n=1 Tax=Deinococcus rubellus TaxID=1889240 RepID=A0ABY5YGA1_9DEIO|nr:LacI family DNA-binding transcriptional regulator [Deinococcus rubellus]UWX64115.1 LacI family transcriptional regulator [Deinococcus rubellus]
MSKRPPSRSGVTIQDVARASGVSIATVSRALKQQSGLSEVTREQVVRAAHDLGYDTAKLRASKLRRISFLLHRQHTGLSANPFYSQVLHGVEDECRARGLTLHFSSLNAGDNVAEMVGWHGTDGLLCVGFFEAAVMEQLRALGLPLVLIDHFAPGLPCVNSDNFGGAHWATTHLLNTGRRRVAFIGGPDHHSIRGRWLGYRQALYDAGVPADPALDVRRDPLDEEEGAAGAMRSLLALPEPPDAVFAFNDVTAILAMQVCQEAGLRVPDDVAFVGFDDLDAAALTHPPLSTLRVDKEALGARGVQLLLERGGPDQIEIPVELLVRASSAEAG